MPCVICPSFFWKVPLLSVLCYLLWHCLLMEAVYAGLSLVLCGSPDTMKSVYTCIWLWLLLWRAEERLLPTDDRRRPCVTWSKLLLLKPAYVRNMRVGIPQRLPDLGDVRLLCCGGHCVLPLCWSYYLENSSAAKRKRREEKRLMEEKAGMASGHSGWAWEGTACNITTAASCMHDIHSYRHATADPLMTVQWRLYMEAGGRTVW